MTVLPLAQWQAMGDRDVVIDLHEPPPLLVVEVVSESRRTDDYRSKRSEYGLLKIPESWIVDPTEAALTLYVLEHQFYDSTVYQADERIPSPTFPELQLTVAQLLKGNT